MIDIALLGYGQVGKEVVRLLRDSQEFNIKYIVGLGSDAEPAHITNPEIIYADRTVAIVIDATSGDIEEAEATILGLAKSGKKIISSNQQLWKERGRMIRRQLEAKNLPVILLNSLVSGPNINSSQENVNLRNLHQFDKDDLFAYRGATEVHIAKAIIQDLIRISS